MLRLKRHVEMYQWHEHVTEHKENDGSKTKSYSYTEGWSSSHQRTVDSRNPRFPYSNSLILESADGVHIEVARNHSSSQGSGKPSPLFFHLSPDFLKRLTHWTPCSVEYSAPSRIVQFFTHHLDPLPGGRGFYTQGHSEETPQIGDIRVTYQGIPQGPYTALAKVAPSGGGWGDHTKRGDLVPFKGQLTQSLASQDDLIVPSDAGVVTRLLTGTTTFCIPDFIIEAAERYVLTELPLEFAYLQPSERNKNEALKAYHKLAAKNYEKMHLLASTMCSFGACFATFPGIMPPAFCMSAFVTGLTIAQTTRFQARQQVKSRVATVAVASEDGVADVKLS